MDCRVCPWWLGFTIDNPLRRWIFQPDKFFSRYLRPGMIALDIGCGMGINSLSMARLVGPAGRVIAVDIQARMLAALEKRARSEGLDRRITTRLTAPDSLPVAGPVDFAVAFWMVHEVPDPQALLRQVRDCLAPDGRFLVVEPVLHVSRSAFAALLESARVAGLRVMEQPRIPTSRAVLLQPAL